MTPPARRVGSLLILLSLALAASGCKGAPRSRLGALPFPGKLTLYNAVDPERLGRHRYGWVPRFFRTDEKQRGILYTTRAGFLDVAHVRITIDQARYCTRAFADAIDRGDTAFRLAGPNQSVWHVTLNYPPDWPDLPPEERRALADELALRCGQRLGYLMLTWHELITWFGYRNVFVVDERRSAFLPDDVMSHVVGLRVADRAFRQSGTAREVSDDTVTAALAAELADLGAVPPAQTDAAARAVAGHWYADGEPLKRQPDVGLESGVVRPWLVPGLPFALAPAEPEAFPLPRLDDVAGRHLSGFCTAEVEPRILEAGRMRRHLPGRPARFSAERDLPLLLRVVREQMHHTFGPEVDEPWPAPPPPHPAG